MNYGNIIATAHGNRMLDRSLSHPYQLNLSSLRGCPLLEYHAAGLIRELQATARDDIAANPCRTRQCDTRN